MSKIKICGLSRLEDIHAVNTYLPDYIGFVFAKSKRQVSFDTAKVLKANLDDRIKAVGVFVNEKPEDIIKLCCSNVIDIIQLHGDEDNQYLNHLKNYVTNPIIKAVRVKDKEEIQRAESYLCDYLLFDTYTENQYGGSGLTFDWSILTDIKKPYFLAGGIDVENITLAQNQCNPYCIDVSSGVETGGYKDEYKIRELISKIRSVK